MSVTSLSLERGAVSAAALLAGLVVVAAFAAPVAVYSVTLTTCRPPLRPTAPPRSSSGWAIAAGLRSNWALSA